MTHPLVTLAVPSGHPAVRPVGRPRRIGSRPSPSDGGGRRSRPEEVGTSTEPAPSQPTPAELTRYWQRVELCLRRLLASRGVSITQVDDVCQDVALQFCRDPAGIMARYPAPAAFAAATGEHRALDHARRERAQRGQGARLVRGPDGQAEVGRAVVPFGPVHEAGLTGSTRSVEDEALDRVEAGRVLGAVPTADRAAFYEVVGLGRSIAEAAVTLGRDRSVVSRRISGQVRRLSEREDRAS